MKHVLSFSRHLWAAMSVPWTSVGLFGQCWGSLVGVVGWGYVLVGAEGGFGTRRVKEIAGMAPSVLDLGLIPTQY